MKILLIGNYEPDDQESMMRFVTLLEGGLTSSGISFTSIKPASVLGRLFNKPHPLKKWVAYIDKLVVFPMRVLWEQSKADIAHVCDHSNAPYLFYLRPKVKLITCHDLIAVRSGLGLVDEHKTGRAGSVLQRFILRGIDTATFVSCVSNETKQQLLLTRDIPESKVNVIYNGLNFPYAEMPRAEAERRLEALGFPSESKFILHVGNNHWYKNRPSVLKAFAILRQKPEHKSLQLIMAGKPWTSEMRSLVFELGISNEVFELTKVPNEDLMALYSLAGALVFPSLREGFGWPIIEAQACGCPVVTANRAPMTEVAGGAAVFVDPCDAESIAHGIETALHTGRSLRELGLVNAEKFSAQSMVQSYIDLYRKLVAD